MLVLCWGARQDRSRKDLKGHTMGVTHSTLRGHMSSDNVHVDVHLHVHIHTHAHAHIHAHAHVHVYVYAYVCM